MKPYVQASAGVNGVGGSLQAQQNLLGLNGNAAQQAGGDQAIPTDVARISVASTTVYHLVVRSNFSGGTSQGGYGKLRARRVR